MIVHWEERGGSSPSSRRLLSVGGNYDAPLGTILGRFGDSKEKFFGPEAPHFHPFPSISIHFHPFPSIAIHCHPFLQSIHQCAIVVQRHVSEGCSTLFHPGSDARSLEDWKDAIAQIEENIKELLDVGVEPCGRSTFQEISPTSHNTGNVWWMLMEFASFTCWLKEKHGNTYSFQLVDVSGTSWCPRCKGQGFVPPGPSRCAAGKHRDPQVFSGTLAAKQDCRQCWNKNVKSEMSPKLRMQMLEHSWDVTLWLFLLLCFCVGLYWFHFISQFPILSNSHPQHGFHGYFMVITSQHPLGKELQKQLSQRVLNEDLRAFLELIQRVQAWREWWTSHWCFSVFLQFIAISSFLSFLSFLSFCVLPSFPPYFLRFPNFSHIFSNYPWFSPGFPRSWKWNGWSWTTSGRFIGTSWSRGIRTSKTLGTWWENGYKVVPPQLCLLVYNPNNYGYNPHKP